MQEHPKKQNSSRISLNVPERLKKRILRLAKENHRDISKQIRALLEDSLDRAEEVQK